MTYQETLDWLFNQLPVYQKIGKSAYKADLSNIRGLVSYLENPQNKYKTIHVGGTNGKGSSSHMIASVLQEAGYKVGLYTSPHLIDFRERIKINGEMISEDEVVGFVKKHKSFFETSNMSFFEMTLGLAFKHFADNNVDVAVIEVGLGGRLDATNIITPEICLITNIGIDHTNFLGDTYESIAKEKAGIIKTEIPVIISETQEETKSVFIEKANEVKASIVFADKEQYINYETDLMGDYQRKNINGVLALFKNLDRIMVSENDIVEGLSNVVRNTGLLGRWQVIENNPKVVCDTAHNKEGLSLTMKQLKEENFEELHIVFGVVSDKKTDEILPLLPKNATYYFCEPNISRALSSSELKEQAMRFGLMGDDYASVSEAFKKAKENSQVNDFIYVGGSTFVVAEIL